MLLGFISLLLTVGQGPISNICVSESVGNSWHPCPKTKSSSYNSSSDDGSTRRKLLQEAYAAASTRRVLAGGGSDKCAEKARVIPSSRLLFPVLLLLHQLNF